MPVVEADPDGRLEVVDGEFGEVPEDDGFAAPLEAALVDEAPEEATPDDAGEDDAEEDDAGEAVPAAGAAAPFVGVAPEDAGEADTPEPALAEPALEAAAGDGPSAFAPLAAGDPAVAAFGAPTEAVLAGLAAALAIPAFEGALGEAAAGETAVVDVAGVEAAGVETAGDDAAPAAATGFVALAEDAPELAAADEAPAPGVEAAGVGEAADDGAAAPPFSGACALGRSAAASALASGLASGFAAGVAVVLSPSLTVVFFSALRSIVWPRVFVGRDRRGRLVIASAPCLRSRRRRGWSPSARHFCTIPLVLHSHAWRKHRVHLDA